MTTANCRVLVFVAVMTVVSLTSCTGPHRIVRDLSDIVEQSDGSPDATSQEFTKTSSGLKYRIVRDTSGKKPNSTDTVTINYRGRLDNGTVFDNTYTGETVTVPLSDLIPGLAEGIQLIGEGGKIELDLPSDLGYGQRGSLPDVPPDATLHYVVELIQIESN